MPPGRLQDSRQHEGATLQLASKAGAKLAEPSSPSIPSHLTSISSASNAENVLQVCHRLCGTKDLPDRSEYAVPLDLPTKC